jgi:sugar/nucleoside kinase (ribokinase family)
MTSRSRRSGVACIGSIIVDSNKVIDSYPALDHLATIEHVSRSTGGPGLNMAVNLTRLGATFPVWMLGAVGDDSAGRYVRDECSRLGIDTSGVTTVAGARTAFTDAMVEREGGRRTFFHHRGANARLDTAAVSLERLQARIVHAGAPGIHDAMDATHPDGGNGWSTLLRRAQDAGMRTNMELVDVRPDRMEDLVGPCLPHLDSLIINELEAGALTGIEAPAPEADGPVDWPRLEAMARDLLERGVSTLAVVHFPAGCVAAAPGGRTWRQGSVRVEREEVLSTTGAGDAFAAGVVYGIHDGWTVEKCLRLGVASAAASIRSRHTSAGIEPADRCLHDADGKGYRPAGNADGR